MGNPLASMTSAADQSQRMAAPRPAEPTLSIIVPAYNEATTIATVLDGVRATKIAHQIVVVDDGSTDGTGAVARRWAAADGGRVAVVTHPRNLGKGRAIRSALPLLDGSHVVVQDADLECDPGDLARLLATIRHAAAPVVFGSRYLTSGSEPGWRWNRLGVRLLNGVVWICYGRMLTDEAGCYKMLPTALLRSLDLRCRRFEFCPEVTAKLCRLGWPIVEIPVWYRPRSAAQGKKLRMRDGLSAILCLLRWRITPLPRAALRPGEFGSPTEANQEP